MIDDDALESRSLKFYLDRISKVPVYSDEDERELGRQIQQGDKAALRKLVEANLRFVVSYVKKYRGMGLNMLDLVNEGNLGLMEAAKRFDPSRNVRFISYAVWWIRQAVIHALTENSRIYNLPQKLSDQISQIKKWREKLKTELSREPTREEIARSLKMSEEDVEDLEILSEKNISLNEPGPEGDSEVEDCIRDELSPSVEYQIIKASIQEQIREILKELDEKEALVLKLRFGLNDDLPLTLQEVGEKLHLTRERIRQIEQKAMRKLSMSHKLQQLRGYLN
jgi:RNA polymerase primary sigma factor